MKVLVVISGLLAACCSVVAVAVPPDSYAVESSTLAAVDGASYKTEESRQTGSACLEICNCVHNNSKVEIKCDNRGLLRVPRLDLKLSIVKMSIFSNYITTLDETFKQDVQLLEELELLDLSFNPLRLPSGPILRSNFMKMLWMIGCGLEHIRPDTFSELPALQDLDLLGNRITTLTVEHFWGLRSLKSLWLDGNPLRCDCPLQRLREYCDQKAITPGILPSCDDTVGQSIQWSDITGYCTLPIQETDERMLAQRPLSPGQEEKPPLKEGITGEVNDHKLSQSSIATPSNEVAVQQSDYPLTKEKDREGNDHKLSQNTYDMPSTDVDVSQSRSPLKQESVREAHDHKPPHGRYVTPSEDVDVPQNCSPSKKGSVSEVCDDRWPLDAPGAGSRPPPPPAVATSVAVVCALRLILWSRLQQQ